MSKEFEKWMGQFEKTPEYLADSFHWADMAKDAFAAGRALGRREAKGESVKVVNMFDDQARKGEYVTKADIVDAIEAIPEEV